MADARLSLCPCACSADNGRKNAVPRRFALLFAVGAALSLTGCGGGGGSKNSGDTTKKATISIYHTLVTEGGETGAMDIVVNRKSQGAGIVYLGASVDRTLEWTPSSGDQYVKLTRSGDANALLLQTALLFDPDETYSLFVVGEANASAVTRLPSIVVLPRDTKGLAAGSFRVRFVHALADVGPVDVYVGATGTEFKLVSNLTFRNGTSYGDISVSLLPLRVTITPAGVEPSPDPLANFISVSNTDANFQAGKIYTEALVHRRSDASSAPTILSVQER